MAEYQPPYNGLPPRVIKGEFCKDAKDGYTSNFADIQRQATKTPGPGLYVQHPDWTNAPKKAMGRYNSEPSYSWGKCGSQRTDFTKNGPGSGMPGPGMYKVRPEDIMKNRAPNQPRVLQGKWSTAPKKWSLTVQSNDVPGPGNYKPQYMEDSLNKPGPLMGASAKKHIPRDLGKKDPPGPGTYKPGWTLMEPRQTGAAWGKTKAVQKRYTDIVANSKKFLPDPGTYPLIKLENISRGGKWSQVHGVARSAIHGTY